MEDVFLETIAVSTPGKAFIPQPGMAQKTELPPAGLRILLHERSRHHNVEWMGSETCGRKAGAHRSVECGCKPGAPPERQGRGEAFGSGLATGGAAVPRWRFAGMDGTRQSTPPPRLCALLSFYRVAS